MLGNELLEAHLLSRSFFFVLKPKPIIKINETIHKSIPKKLSSLMKIPMPIIKAAAKVAKRTNTH